VKNILILITTLLFIQNISYASDEAYVYIGGGITKTTLKIIEYSEINSKANIGIRTSNAFAFEVQFANFKKSSIVKIPGFDYSAKIKSLGVSSVIYLNKPVKKTFNAVAFLKLGLHIWRGNAVIDVLGVKTKVSDDGIDAIKGVGIDLPNDVFITRVEYEQYKLGGEINQTMKSFGVSVIFAF